jgi:hypothetical protein
MNPQTPTPNPNRGLIFAALAGAGAMLLLVVAVLMGYWLGSRSAPTPTHATAAPVATPTVKPNPATLPLQPIITDPVTDLVQTPVATITASEPNTDPLLTAPLPADTALAGEEIDRHGDEQQRLAQQKQILQQQKQDSDELMKLKEERIKALEAALANPS